MKSFPYAVAISAALILVSAPVQADPTDGAETGAEQADEDASTHGEFLFGSYGRTQFELDDRGNAGTANNIVSHGPRLFQEDYAEFDLSYTLEQPDGFTSRVLFTFALFGPFAHYDGDFADQAFAVRNLYAEMSGLSAPLEGLSLWAGSRMYRGDDIYLLDWWPLDELNTVGGGASWRASQAPGGFEARVHAGVNRLDNNYQLQVIDVPAQPVGTRSKVLLDRQRLLSSARLEYAQHDLLDKWGAKAILYGEYHRLPEGERISPDLIEDGAPIQQEDLLLETLPSDDGFVLGGQLGLFESDTANHLNLFFRWSRGIAAFGELGVPFGTARDGTAQGADELLGALSGNWESRWFGVLAGAYLRRFEDADVNEIDTDEFVEGTVAVRPAVFLTDHFHQAVELSYQRRYPFGLDADTGQHDEPAVFQLSALEILSFGRGNYERPQIHLGYTVAFANEAAQRAFPEGDTRRPEPVEHIFSVGAEWWFNSSTY